MTISDKINKHCVKNSDKYDTVPCNFDCVISSNEEIEIKASWPTEEPTHELITHPNRETFNINKSDDIYNEIYNKLSGLKSDITLPNNATVDSISVSNKPKDEFQDSKYISHVNITITKPIFKSIVNQVHKELMSVEPEITTKQIVEIDCRFKDSTNLYGIEGYVVTEQPHKYNNNIDSFDDYISINSHKKSKEELKKQDNYLVHFVMKNKLENTIKSIMKEQIETVHVSGKYISKAESIIIYNNTSHQEYKTDESKTSKVNFSIIKPVTF